MTDGPAGLFYGGGGIAQLGKQVLAVAVVGLYAFGVTYVLGKLIDRFFGFRVDRETEASGIDLQLHAESAYEHGVLGHGPIGGGRRGTSVPSSAPDLRRRIRTNRLRACLTWMKSVAVHDVTRDGRVVSPVGPGCIVGDRRTADTAVHPATTRVVAAHTGRRSRAVFTAVVFVLDQRMRMAAPATLVRGTVPTAHRRFVAWARAGVFEAAPCGSRPPRWCRRTRLVGSDPWMRRASGRKGGSLTGPSPVDRGKKGSRDPPSCPMQMEYRW